MSAGALIDHALDETRALELIFGDTSLPCRGINKNGCSKDAEYSLDCPCDGGSTQLCSGCLEQLCENAIRGVKDVCFNPARACGHSVLLIDCTVLPI